MKEALAQCMSYKNMQSTALNRLMNVLVFVHHIDRHAMRAISDTNSSRNTSNAEETFSLFLRSRAFFLCLSTSSNDRYVSAMAHKHRKRPETLDRFRQSARNSRLLRIGTTPGILQSRNQHTTASFQDRMAHLDLS